MFSSFFLFFRSSTLHLTVPRYFSSDFLYTRDYGYGNQGIRAGTTRTPFPHTHGLIIRVFPFIFISLVHLSMWISLTRQHYQREMYSPKLVPMVLELTFYLLLNFKKKFEFPCSPVMADRLRFLDQTLSFSQIICP